YWERALAAAQAGGDRRNEGHLYFIRGDRELQAGHLETAVTLTQKSVAIIRSFDDPPHLILALSVLVDLLTAQQRPDAARAVVAEAQQLAAHLSIKWHSLLVAIASARLLIAERQFDQAEMALAVVLASVPAEGSYQSLRQMALYHRGCLCFLQGAYADAAAAWQQCVAMADSTDFLVNSRIWRALVGLGEVALCVGDVETAVSHFITAHELAHCIGADAAWELEVGRLAVVYQDEAVGVEALAGTVPAEASTPGI
ncbi:MAG: hypothetical protein KC419_25630, partial [Anaerolineales bacterium]|nr:hypothetical protein [Anaerolineales bacterium]